MVGKLPFLPDEHHYAMAHVAIRSAQLDHEIEFAVHGLLAPLIRTADNIVGTVAQDRLVNLLADLLADRFPSEAAEAAALITQIRRARTDRNDILHWVWGQSEEEGKAFGVRAKPGKELRTAHRTAEEIDAIALSAFDCVCKLKRYLERFRERQSLVDALQLPGISWPPSRPGGLLFGLAQDQLDSVPAPEPPPQPLQE